jgi:hypothetical protein
MLKTVPPAEVSRLALFVLVGAGVVIAFAAGGDLSHFGAGFAAGAGSALVLSRLRRAPGEPAADGENSEDSV